MNLPFLLLILGVSPNEHQQWEDYKITYNKKYGSVQEEVHQRSIFLKNLKGSESFSQEKTFEIASVGIEYSQEQDEDPNPLLDLEQDALKFEVDQRWNEFKMTHEKKYNRFGEEMKRKEIFKRNLEVIRQHNERFYQGLETFSMGVNQFTDLTTEEFRDTYLTPRPSNETAEDSWEESNEEEEQAPLTKTISWYTARIPIKNQGHCGSCWAFSVTGVLEYAYFINNKKVVSLSEQEILDCDHKSAGCAGGVPYYAMQWVQKHGINFERDYPYEARNSTCRSKKNSVEPNIIKSVGLARGEKAMLQKLKSTGPIQVSVDANHWHHYNGGYFTHASCMGRASNHAVVAIGAISENGKDVWLLRNSWGAHWGMGGHAKLLMYENTCNIAQDPGVYINH